MLILPTIPRKISSNLPQTILRKVLPSQQISRHIRKIPHTPANQQIPQESPKASRP
ncbi:MAG: hypothetical protein IJS39_11455 [Synergistaceae bacterium]|nr:hypothetical protein [Synergistaceae bacterium]